MRYAITLLCLGATAASLSGQQQAVDTSAWQDAQKANDARAKGHRAEAELLIQSAWSATQRAGAAEEYFPAAVQSVVNFYVSAGRGLKSDDILHAAEAAVAPLPPQHPNRLAILTLKAQTYQNQGRAVEAQAIYEQVLPLQAKTFGEDSFEVRASLQTLARSYEESGELEKAEALFRKLDSLNPRVIRSNQAAAPFYDRRPVMIIATGRTAVMSRAGFAVSAPIVFPGQAALADFYDRHGRFADAEKAFQDSIARAESGATQDFTLADALSAYERFLHEHHRYSEAEQVQIRIIQLRQNSGGERNANRDVMDHVNLSNIYMDAGQFDQANKVLDQTRLELETSQGVGSSEYRNFQQTYAYALLRQRNFAAAERVARELDDNAPSDPSDYTHQAALGLLAQIHDQSGDHEGAETYRSQVAAIQNSRVHLEPSAIAADIESARTLLSQHKIDQAWSQINHALGTAESAEPYQTSGFLNEIANLGSSFATENSAMVDQLVERIEAVEARMFAPADPLFNPSLVTNYYESGERWAEAERRWNNYIAALENANGTNHPRLTMPLNQLANLFRRERRLVDAVATERRVLNIEEATKGPNSDAVILTLGLLGELYFDVQNEKAAMEVYERQIRLDGRMFGRALPHAQTLTNIAMAYAEHRQFDRAIELATEARDIVSQPEYAGQAQYFRSVLESIERRKAAATRSPNGATSRWFETDHLRPHA